MTPMLKRLCAAAIVLGLSWTLIDLGTRTVDAQEKDKKDKKEKEKNPLEGKKGTTIGTLVEKGPSFIEVKADGEEKGRRYVPQWKGGAPAQGGGFDKDTVKMISELKIGSRLEVEWLFEERFRVLKVKVLKLPTTKDKDK